MGCGALDYRQQAQQMELRTGGMSVSTQVIPDSTELDVYEQVRANTVCLCPKPLSEAKKYIVSPLLFLSVCCLHVDVQIRKCSFVSSSPVVHFECLLNMPVKINL